MINSNIHDRSSFMLCMTTGRYFQNVTLCRLKEIEFIAHDIKELIYATSTSLCVIE